MDHKLEIHLAKTLTEHLDLYLKLGKLVRGDNDKLLDFGDDLRIGQMN